MELLKQTIQKKGIIMNDQVLKVDSFINHQIDTLLLDQIGEAIGSLFKDEPITKILTIETSGIPFACSAARFLNHVPVIFAKKHQSLVLNETCYSAEVYSFTKQQQYQIRVDQRFLQNHDKVLIIDDFLANGQAAKGLMNIVKESGAQVVGFCSIIEKGFQKGRLNIQKEFPDVIVKSLANIKHMSNEHVIFS